MSSHSAFQRVVVTVLLLSVAAAFPPQAPCQVKPDARANAETARDPAAVALRDKMVKAYRDLHAFHEKITQRQWKTTPDDALTVEIEMRYRRPNRLYLAIDYPRVGQAGRWQLIYASDGKTLTVYNSARNEYQTTKSPARLDRLVLPQVLRGPEFAALFGESNPFDALEKSAIVQYSEAFEDSASGSWHTLKLVLQQDGARRTLQYRIGPKDNLVHGIALSIVPDADSGGPFVDPEVKSRLEANYTLVDENPHFTDSDFRFVPPPGAKMQQAERPAPASGSAKDHAVKDGRPQ